MKSGRRKFGKVLIFGVIFTMLASLSVSCTSASVNSIQLTTSTADDIHPSWSPDGSKILFSSNRSGNYDIWVMDSDGSNKVQLTSNSSDENYPVWNHAGNKIAFTRGRYSGLWYGGAYQLWIMNSDGSNPQKLNVNDTWRLISPTWSPDDTKIAFATRYPGNIYSYNIAAATTTDITPPDERWPSGVISRVSWGPTDRIAYDRWPVGIQTIDSSGGDYQVIVPEFEIGHPPAQSDWSPNGTRFVLSLYGANKEKSDLALAWNIPNSREEVLENTTSLDVWPSWNPANESEIVFVSGGDFYLDSSQDIWLMAIGPTPEEHDILVTFDKGFLDVPLNTLYDVVASVKNTRTVSDTFNLEITNNPCGLSTTITPQNVTLSPLEEQQVTVQVYVPDTVTEPSCTLQLSAISVATGFMDTDDITIVSGCFGGALTGANLAVVYDSNSIWAYNSQLDAWTRQSVGGGDLQGARISDNLAVVYDSDSIWAYNPQLDTWKRQDVMGILGVEISDNLALVYDSDDIWAYNPGKDAWKEQHITGGGIQEVEISNNLALVYDSQGDAIWAYNLLRDAWNNQYVGTIQGARISDNLALVYDSDDVWAYNLLRDVWKEQHITGGGIQEVEISNNLALAYDSQGDDIWAYNLQTDAWKNQYVGTIQGARISDNLALVYDSDDVWAYNLLRDAWKEQHITGGGIQEVEISNNLALVYDSQGDDIWAYNPQTDAWKNQYVGTIQGARISDNLALVYDSDDVWAYNPGKDAWKEQHITGGGIQEVEISNNLALVYDSQGDDVWAYNLPLDVWKEQYVGAIQGARISDNLALVYDSDDIWAYNPGKDAWKEQHITGGGIQEVEISNNLALVYDSQGDDVWAYNSLLDAWKEQYVGAIKGAQISDNLAVVYDSDEIWAFAPTSVSAHSRQLTTSTADDIHPSWSPDGTKILFSSNRSGNYDIWVMDSDGSNKVQLTSNSSDEKYPVWNHAGDKIAFTRHSPPAYDRLWIMNSDGSNQQNLNIDGGYYHQKSPTWSPDDSKIAFFSYRWEPHWRELIYSYDIVSNTVTNITPAHEEWPGGVISRVSWGPTDRIAYDRWPVGIQTIDSSGGDYQVIVPEFRIGPIPVEPDWSPEGTRFVFSLDEYPTCNLALAWNIPNSREEVLEDTASVDEWPSWNPANGSGIVFMSGGDYFFGSHDIWIYNPQIIWTNQHVPAGIQGVEISDNLAVVYDSDRIWAYNPQRDTWKEQYVGGIQCPASL